MGNDDDTPTKPIREIHVWATAVLAGLESYKLKQERAARKKPYREAIGGTLMSNSGRVVKKTRIIDREQSLYVEKVVEVATGEGWRDVEQPLSQHRSNQS